MSLAAPAAHDSQLVVIPRHIWRQFFILASGCFVFFFISFFQFSFSFSFSFSFFFLNNEFFSLFWLGFGLMN